MIPGGIASGIAHGIASGVVALNTGDVRDFADQLVEAYEGLKAAQPMELSGGRDDLAETEGFKANVDEAVRVYNWNRSALITQLGALSEAMRLLSDNFMELEEKTRQGLFNLESEAHAILDAQPTAPEGSQSSDAAVGTRAGQSPPMCFADPQDGPAAASPLFTRPLSPSFTTGADGQGSAGGGNGGGGSSVGGW